MNVVNSKKEIFSKSGKAMMDLMVMNGFSKQAVIIPLQNYSPYILSECNKVLII